MKPSESMNPPAIAVIGSGYWGRNLVRNYHALGALRLICDRNEMLREALRLQYPGVESCMAYNEVLTRGDIDGVVIATPAETHYTLAREALLAGKHVYVEKPLVLRESEAGELVELAGAGGLVLMVGHLLQYHPGFVRLRQMAGEGELGRINYIYSHRLNLGKIRREENILWSFAPHDISMILALAGEEPESVYATGGSYLHKRIADVTTTHLEFPSGLRAHIFVSWLHPFKEQKLVVVGERKMAVFDDTQPWHGKLQLYAHEIKWQQNVPVPARAEPERVQIQEAEPLRLECEAFLRCIARKEQPATDGREGLRVLRVLNAAQASLDNPGNRMAPQPVRPMKESAGCRTLCPPERSRGPGSCGRAGHEDLAFQSRPTRLADRGRLHDRAERGHRTRGGDRGALQDPEQRLGLQGGAARGRRVLRSLDGFHQRVQPAGRDQPDGSAAADPGRTGSHPGSQLHRALRGEDRAVCFCRRRGGGDPRRAGPRSGGGQSRGAQGLGLRMRRNPGG